MTAPNPAATARPGQRFTDPDGGTWWRVGGYMADKYEPWLSTGDEPFDDLRWRSQEEAEAAGLVPLVAETEVDAAKQRMFDSLTEARRERGETERECPTCDGRGDAPVPAPLGVDELAQVIREVDGYHTLGAGALAEAIVERLRIPAPSPLDPGNPEHESRALRFAADVMTRHGNGALGRQYREKADRLDRERAEAEQDAADRKRAEAYADELRARGTRGWQDAVDDFLAGLRAGRAERQEAEK